MLKEIKTRTEKRLLELMHLVNAFKRLDSSIKGEVKRKHRCNGRKFSCFAAHVNEQGLF
jgi:hypothetical protein